MTLAFAPAAPDRPDLLVLLAAPDGALPPAAEALGGRPEQAALDAEPGGEAVVWYPPAGARRVAIVRLAAGEDRPEAARVAGAQAAALAARFKAEHVAVFPFADDAPAVVEGFVLGGYRYDRYRTGDAALPVARVTVVGAEPSEAVTRALVGAEAACLARDLVNLSPHDKTAHLLADAAVAALEPLGVRAEVWDRERIVAERMGGLLAVSRGSVAPPTMLVLEWAPEGTEGAAPVVLVGKAVVFDTGGLSLKPTKDSMDKMKADMAGGAAVVGALAAAARLGLPLRVVGLVPATDNRPGGDAFVPGEVVTMRSGATVEVLNTDAEGRMLLADALDLAADYGPAEVVSIATLTGAQMIALGGRVAALLTPRDGGREAREAAFLRAGDATGEWVAPLPLRPHYAEQLKSDVADLANVGGSEAGTVTAAAFLHHFVRRGGADAYPWVHLDIAAPAFTRAPLPYRPKGGTGFGVRLLLAWLLARAGAGA